MNNNLPLFMLSGELSFQNLPQLNQEDKIFQVLQLMTDSQVAHLPVVDDGKFIGLISENVLLEADNDQNEISFLQDKFEQVSVKNSEHFLKAVYLAAEFSISVMPIVNEENILEGTVLSTDLLKTLSKFLGLGMPGGVIVFEMDSKQFSFSEVSKLVETNDAQITQLNTSFEPGSGILQVTIRINKPEVSDIVSTFQRYEYNVKYYFGEELYANELRTNYDNLMNYLEI